MQRKQFIHLCAGTMAAGLLGSTLQGCSKSYYAQHTVSGKAIIIPLTEFANGDNTQQPYRSFVLVKNELLNFPIAVYRHSEKSYSALYLECTHKGCELNPASTVLQCPCHGSEFSTTGKVLSAPAEHDLKQFTVTVNTADVTIEITNG